MGKIALPTGSPDNIAKQLRRYSQNKPFTQSFPPDMKEKPTPNRKLSPTRDLISRSTFRYTNESCVRHGN